METSIEKLGYKEMFSPVHICFFKQQFLSTK